MTADEIKHPPSALIGEAASLFFLLGGMAAKHLVIEYYRSIEEILEPYFESERASGFRWRKKADCARPASPP